MEKMTLREQSQWLLEGNLSNFGESGSQLGSRFQGEYLIVLTLVEANLDIDK